MQLTMSFASPTASRPTPHLPVGTLAQGTGEPLILLHGVMGTPHMWQEALPLLSVSYRVLALPALGHHGGRPCHQRPCRLAYVVDDAERSLDALGITQAHIAGNSMGGWMAIELARRGRARSVCALSPAGLWDSTESFDGAKKLRATVQLTRLSRRTLSLSAKLPPVRRFALRDNAEHGDRVSPQLLIAMADALLGCTVAEDLLSTPEKLEPLGKDHHCPIDVVWSGRDRIFPREHFAAVARERIPGARHLTLDGLGHVPMLDDPTQVANAILNTIARV